MAKIVEVDSHVSIEVRKSAGRVWLDETVQDIPFERIPALSRALSIIKESPRYVAWLKAQGLA